MCDTTVSLTGMTLVESPRQGGADETAPPSNGNGEAKTTTSTPSSRTDIVTNTERNGTGHEKEQREQSLRGKIWKVLTWTPPNCRWDPEKPPQFSMSSTSFVHLQWSFPFYGRWRRCMFDLCNAALHQLESPFSTIHLLRLPQQPIHLLGHIND